MRPKNSHYSHAPVPFQFYKYDLYFIQTVTDLCAFCLNSEISLIRYFFLQSFCQEMRVPLESKFKWKYRLSQVIVHGCSSCFQEPHRAFLWPFLCAKRPRVSCATQLGLSGHFVLKVPWLFEAGSVFILFIIISSTQTYLLNEQCLCWNLTSTQRSSCMNVYYNKHLMWISMSCHQKLGLALYYSVLWL